MRVGIRFEPHWPADRLQSFARVVESLGYDHLWLTEDCFCNGGLTAAGVALASTERLNIGIGLLPVGTRNPATIAMELATLAHCFPGRHIPAFGRGVFDWMAQISARDAGSLRGLEESVRVVRALLSGALVNAPDNSIALRDVQLAHAPRVVPPVLIGSTGTRGLRVAHRVADGIVLPELSSPLAVEWARSQAGDAQRTVVYAMLSIDDDAVEALQAARPVVERWARSGLFPRLTELAGIGADGQGPLKDEQLSLMTVAGTPANCAEAVRRWEDAGVDDLVLLARDPDADDQVDRFARQVLAQRER
jgi:5,10-methylenetetrahydromethanopterin reductase